MFEIHRQCAVSAFVVHRFEIYKQTKFLIFFVPLKVEFIGIFSPKVVTLVKETNSDIRRTNIYRTLIISLHFYIVGMQMKLN